MSEPNLPQDEPELIDDIVPTRGYQLTPVVALGASAGGLAPMLDFFRAMPADSGLVFVVVMHLSPTHTSTLGTLLSRATSMRVHDAEDGQTIEPNNVYVIPPGKLLRSADGKLSLEPMSPSPSKRSTIDLFFRTLADSHGPHAIAIVFSGADGDGAVGVKRVKERGGLTIVQDPNEAEHASMPRAAIATGMADWVLKTSEMPARIVAYVAHDARRKLPAEDGPQQPAAPRTKEDNESALREVLLFLRTRTGRDFAPYKRATILRRIARRMQVNGVEDLPAYVAYMRTHPGESGALLQDLLISVTNFFRDRDAFDALARLIPSLFANKDAGDSVRVWVPACATGEEAYSIAILLLEHAQTLDAPPPIQVFACDLDEDAIQVARAGHYPNAISTDVSEERLRRFFTQDSAGYRVRREMREMILFATHDMIKDAPFSRMDLISCRNLLIYLGRDAQRRLLEIFHFALRPGGKLFLGTSESVDEANPLFKPLDKKNRIYVQQPTTRGGVPVPVGPTTLLRTIQAHDENLRGFVRDKPFETHAQQLPANLDRAELHFKMLEQLAPPSVLVDADHHVVHLSERAGRFMKIAGGEPTLDLLRIVDPVLRADLRAALFRATETNGPIDAAPIVTDVAGEKRAVVMRVMPAPEIAPGYLLVVFEARAGAVAETPDAAPVPPDTVLRSLERELERAKEQLRSNIEQYEASNEELKASNEELQAMNEELRSASEELESSREELQSINEELTTVNTEMKARMDELASANSDLQNLMASTAIATVFLNRQLTIMRYTPPAVPIFNLIPGDVGRPLAHLKHKLDYPNLIADAESVQKTLVPIERNVTDGTRWFQARMQPYRTLEDQIGGVVLTLVDVSERNRVTQALRVSEERLQLIIDSAKDYAIFTMDPQRRIVSWSAGAEAAFGWKDNEIIGQLGDVLFASEDRDAHRPENEMNRARDESGVTGDRWYTRKDGTTFFGSGSMMPLREGSSIVGYVNILRDLTKSKPIEDALRTHVEELTRFNAAAVGRETRMIELKKEINELAARLGEPPRYPVRDEE